jgi:hypothetical protein
MWEQGQFGPTVGVSRELGTNDVNHDHSSGNAHRSDDSFAGHRLEYLHCCGMPTR